MSARAVETARGALYYAAFYLSMGVCGALFFIPAALSAPLARRLSKMFFAWNLVLLRAICGLRVELRGALPTGPAMIAAKHQSMLDVFILYRFLPRPRFVMKRELTRAPIFGWFALRVGTVPVDRGGGGAAMRDMVGKMTNGGAAFGQLVIYPQGTRVPPGAHKPYKIGVHALYEATGLPCIPAAGNAGLFQPKGLRVRSGVAVVEFLEPIPPGRPRAEFMARLEHEIETASAELAAEAGFRPG